MSMVSKWTYSKVHFLSGFIMDKWIYSEVHLETYWVFWGYLVYIPKTRKCGISGHLKDVFWHQSLGFLSVKAINENKKRSSSNVSGPVISTRKIPNKLMNNNNKNKNVVNSLM